MTHTAMSSIRVMATCATLGQAVGTAAAVAKKYGDCPHGVYANHLDELKTRLVDADCFLPYVQRDVSASKNARLSGADDCVRDGRDRANRIYNTENCGSDVKNGESVTYTFDGDKKIQSVHIVFDSDLDRETLPGPWCERKHVTRANVLLDSPQMYMPKTLCKGFTLTADTKDGKIVLISEKNNIKRAYHVKTDISVSALSLTIDSNWGGSDSTSVVSFDFKGEN